MGLASPSPTAPSTATCAICAASSPRWAARTWSRPAPGSATGSGRAWGSRPRHDAALLIDRFKDWVGGWWPRLRLRAILFTVLLFTAAMPGFAALYLRVYENTLVRQTEAELVA